MMQVSIFTVGPGQTEAAEEMNRFLRSHRVLTVDRQCQDGVWSFCVTWQMNAPLPEGVVRERTEKIDYKQVLDPPTFALFSALRDVRKVFAEKEALPHYAVFTNEQLATIAKARPATAASLGGIDGIGPARVEKYGAAVLAAVAASAQEGHKEVSRTE